MSKGHELLVEDLGLSFSDLGPLLEQAIDVGDSLDAYLLGAGMSQVIRDYLERDVFGVIRATAMLAKSRSESLARAMRRIATGLSLTLRSPRILIPKDRKLAVHATHLDGLVGELAAQVLSGESQPESAKEVLAVFNSIALSKSPVMSQIIRLPACFRSFDQHPRDLQSLARRVLERWPKDETEFVVVGVRTSGNYLAPLLAAALHQAGCEPVPHFTLRPGHPPSDRVRKELRALSQKGVHSLIIDDPPDSGLSLLRVIHQLESMGFAPERLDITVALLKSGVIPARLQKYPAVILAWNEWDIHRRLSPALILADLTTYLGNHWTVNDLEPLEMAERPAARTHERVPFSVMVQPGESSSVEHLSLVAEGSGLGFFGRHTLAVSRAIPNATAETLGFRDGITIRRWLPEDMRATLDDGGQVRQAVRYIARRRALLPAKRDAALGQQPVWDVAGRILVRPYAMVGHALLELGMSNAVRTLLAASTPSVVDGETGSGSWFRDGDALVKVSFSERDFSHLDLACYDATYDLAGLVLEFTSVELVREARSEFEALTGEDINPEKLLLYRLVHAWDFQRLGYRTIYEVELLTSRAWQDWARVRLLGELVNTRSGPICALDIDGVLEDSRIGTSVLTPSAAEGLHALCAHGFRPVLATGRSLVEVKDRCDRYGLAGGVAEYGGVIYICETEQIEMLVNIESLSEIGRAREYLSDIKGVFVVPQYTTMLRAYRVGPNGRRGPLAPDVVESLLASSEGRLRAIQGHGQTDIVATEVNKANGLKALMRLLNEGGAVPVMAVGDSEPDVPMLRLSERGFVPAHARRLADGNVTSVSRSYQRGFLQIVDEFLGHRREGCQVCDGLLAPDPQPAKLLVALLSGFEGGRIRSLTSVLKLLVLSWAMRD